MDKEQALLREAKHATAETEMVETDACRGYRGSMPLRDWLVEYETKYELLTRIQAQFTKEYKCLSKPGNKQAIIDTFEYKIKLLTRVKSDMNVICDEARKDGIEIIDKHSQETIVEPTEAELDMAVSVKEEIYKTSALEMHLAYDTRYRALVALMIDTWRKRAKLLKRTFGVEALTKEATKSALVDYNEQVKAIIASNQDTFDGLKVWLDQHVKLAASKGILISDRHTCENLEQPADARISHDVSGATLDFIKCTREQEHAGHGKYAQQLPSL